MLIKFLIFLRKAKQSGHLIVQILEEIFSGQVKVSKMQNNKDTKVFIFIEW